MKALQQIIQRVAENPAQPWALATLVQTQGSTYRKAGARLLVDPDGGTLGVLSGGCLRKRLAATGAMSFAMVRRCCFRSTRDGYMDAMAC